MLQESRGPTCLVHPAWCSLVLLAGVLELAAVGLLSSAGVLVLELAAAGLLSSAGALELAAAGLLSSAGALELAAAGLLSSAGATGACGCGGSTVGSGFPFVLCFASLLLLPDEDELELLLIVLSSSLPSSCSSSCSSASSCSFCCSAAGFCGSCCFPFILILTLVVFCFLWAAFWSDGAFVLLRCS